MNINEIIGNLSKCTDEELRNFSRAISTVQQEREDAIKRKAIDEACEALKTLDDILQQTITVEVVDDCAEHVEGELDLLELCEALREYLP